MAEEAKSRSSAPSRSDDEWVPDGDRDEQEPDHGAGRDTDRDEQQITAPSLGPNTVIEREPVEERLAKHDQSEVDAMGLDKRRPVIGQSYGPSKARQLGLYAIFLAVVAALLVGGILLVGHFDKSVDKVPCSAPWCKGNPKQIQPKPIQ